MICPFCGANRDRVIDSREAADGGVIRRRRECEKCRQRFTTYERVEEAPVLVVKRDGSRESFDRQKVLSGVVKACQKRPIPLEKIEALVDEVEREIVRGAEREVSSVKVGERVMRHLHALDGVAYVRFASVYRSFKDINEFMTELKDLLEAKGKKRVKG